MKKTIWLVILAITIRLALALSTYHSDLGAIAQAGKAIAGEGRWFTFYDTIPIPPVDTVFNYQPLAYLLPSFFYLPFRSIVLQTGDLIKNHDWILSNSSFFNPLLLLYKYPMILADLAFLWLLPKFFTEKRQKNLALLLWAFNPLAIFVSSMMGQVDIMIALLITGGLYLYRQDRPYLSMALFSLSALIKPVGLILVPLAALHYLASRKKFLSSLLLLATGLAVYLLGILPYLSSVAYRQFALFAEQIGKSTYAGISIASGHTVPYFFIVYILVLILVWKNKISFSAATAASLLSSLAFSHFHPQWLVWIMPWLVIYTVSRTDYFFYLSLLICWLVILLAFDPSLHLQLFIHSTLSLPSSLVSSSYFTQLLQLSRAGLMATLIWLLTIFD